MPAGGRDRGVGPYEAEVVRRVAERAPLGFAVFLGCLVLNTIFEFLHFPERRVWMEGFAAGFVLLVAVAWALVLRRPAWSVYVMLGFVNAAAVALNAYHLIVGAPVAMGLLSLVGAAILSPDGRCGEVNDELCRMFGYSRPELLRLSWLDLVHAEECRTAAAVLARALSPAGTPQARDMRCVRKDGETLDAIVSVRGLPGPEGAMDHVMVVVQVL